MHKSLNLNWKARESVPLSPQMMLSCRKQPICSGYGINHYLEDLKTNKYGEFFHSLQVIKIYHMNIVKIVVQKNVKK